jgi:hypothetical protein
MTEEYVKRLPDLKRLISGLVSRSDEPLSEGPISFIYQYSKEDSRYKITVELLEEDFYIDSKGRKWIRAKDE